MSSPIFSLLAQLARLSGQPMLIHGDAGAVHAARFAGLLKRALAAQADAALFGDANGGDKLKPWEAREMVKIENGVAIVPVQGTLAGGLDPLTAWWLDCCRYEAIQCAAEMLADRGDVRTVVFDINSPGGYVTGVRETAEIVARELAGKLTLAWAAQQDCSAAFWLSCACQRIVVAPSATVANIGIQAVVYDYSKMYEEAGIGVRVFKSGKYKGAGVPGTSLTADQAEFMQERVDELGAQFVADVQSARPKASPPDMLGQWFTGEQAVARHLADATALNLCDLLEELASASRGI